MRTLMSFPRVMENGDPNESMAPLKSIASLPNGKGTVEWEFSKFILLHLAAPCIWARLHLNVCATFQTNIP